MDGSHYQTSIEAELLTYKIVLCAIVLPVFSLIAPLFFIQQGVAEGYRLLRRTASVAAGFDLPSIEQVRFEGYSLYHAAAAFELILLLTFFVRYRRSSLAGRGQRSLPDAPKGRRFREIPASLRPRVEARVRDLWCRIGTGAPPVVLCFASTSLAACVTEWDGCPAVAISTGLIDQPLDDELGDVILLHELAHVKGRDALLFRRSAAFVDAFRLTFGLLIATLSVTFLASGISELSDFGGLEQRSPSPMAFLTGSAREIVFPYLSMILTLRYVALIIMLTELRADLLAASALRGTQDFVGVVRSAQGFRPSSRVQLVRTWLGTTVTHLTANERLDLLEKPGRLFTPKYRYFAASIGLSILVILNGSLAYSGFDWVIQAGMIATISALNAITVSMAVALPWGSGFAALLPRIGVIVLIVIATNMIFLVSPTEVMGATGQVIVTHTDPNFDQDEAKRREARAEWFEATLKPGVEAVGDGRFALWFAALFACLCLPRLAPRGSSTSFAAAGSALATAAATVVVAGGAPFATYLLLPEQLRPARQQIEATMCEIGPVVPAVLGVVIGVAIIYGTGHVRRLRSRP